MTVKEANKLKTAIDNLFSFNQQMIDVERHTRYNNTYIDKKEVFNLIDLITEEDGEGD